MSGNEKKGIGEVHLWKGVLVNEDNIHVSLQDRGYVFGDGLYEVVRVYNGSLFQMESHLDRLLNGAEIINFNLKHSRQEITQLFECLVSANDLVSGYVYLQLTRGDQGVRNHLFPDYEDQVPVVSGFVNHGKRNSEKIEKGTNGATCEDIRWKLCNAKTLNLLPNCMARNEAKEKGASKAILIKDGYVTEEKSGSILIVKEGKVITRPYSEAILFSITRKVIQEICEELQIPYEERLFTEEELLEADEVICADTNTEVCGVLEINGQPIGDGSTGPITKKLQKAYEDRIVRECGAAL